MNIRLRSCIVSLVVGILLWKDVTCIPFTPVRERILDGPTADRNETETVNYRLDEDVWPLYYDIEITPYFIDEANKSAFTFDGITTITIAALRAGVTSIKLHQSDLDIRAWNLLRKSNSQSVSLRANETYDPVTQIQTLLLPEPLQLNVEYLLTFHYAGVMNDERRGFYRSYFNTSNGEQVWLGVTQFQVSDARRVFPCFDEPKFKAMFQLKINHRTEQYGVYSNTPITSSVELGNNRSLTTFDVTPRMSTYLVAFIVAPFQMSGQDEVTLLTRPEAANQTNYGIQVGLKFLKQFGDWIDYPFGTVPGVTRMYMAAVPDFASGAMENWGLIIGKELVMLYDPEEAASTQQQQTTTLVVHELAHQWFGNLVTCEWWDVAWLNEGFATYMEYFGTDTLEPSWELGQQFVVDVMHRAMRSDAVSWIHPLTYPVQSRVETFAIFDVITYYKGAAVLRMMEHILSTGVFQIALREYVKARAFGTSRPEHLFDAFNRHNSNARAYMEPWTTQPGFPLLTVSRTEAGFTLTQKPFLPNSTDSNEAWLWPVPITYATEPEHFANTTPSIVSTKSHNISVPNATAVRYFILNNQQIGYYRVNYEPSLWIKINQALRSENYGGIHVLNRAQIVDDLFNLAEAQHISYEAARDILEYLKTETEYLPWLAASNGLLALYQRTHPEDEPLFTQYILDVFERVYEQVKFQAPSSSELRVHTYLRGIVLEWTCQYGHEQCTQSAKQEFQRFRTNPSVKVHPDLRPVVYCEGVRQGSSDEFDFLLNLYHTTNVATEKQLVLQGLSCVVEDALIHKFMAFVFSSSVRQQDTLTALSLLLSKPHTIASAVVYFVQNYDALVELYGNPAAVVRILGTIVANSKDQAVRNSIQQFADVHREDWAEEQYTSIAVGLALFDINQQTILHHRDGTREFLTKKYASSSAMPSAVALSATLIVSFALTVAFGG